MIEITKTCIVALMKARNSLVVWCREIKKTEDGENVFFKGLAENFLLKSKSCLWPTFYRMDFMKRLWYVILSCYITKNRLNV